MYNGSDPGTNEAIEDPVRTAVQAEATRLAQAAELLTVQLANDDAVAEIVIRTIGNLESVLFDLGYDVDFGDFAAPDDVTPGYKKSASKRARPSTPDSVRFQPVLGGFSRASLPPPPEQHMELEGVTSTQPDC